MEVLDKKIIDRPVQNKTTLEEKLMEPYLYVALEPGKKTLLKLCKALDFWFNIPKDKLEKIEEIANQFYYSILLIDDIQDNSVLRKGIPTAHQIYGVPFTINSALYIMNSCWKKVFELGNQQAIIVVAETMEDFFKGQGEDVYNRENLICPTVEEYKKLCGLKIGSLFMMVSKLIQMFSNVKYDLSKLSELFGFFLQLRGDYLNLFSEEYSTQKGFCDDLSEGQFSFPIIHAIESQPGNNLIINILKQKPKDFEKKQYLLKLLKEYGSLEYTKQILNELRKELLEEIRRIGDNPELVDLINILNY